MSETSKNETSISGTKADESSADRALLRMEVARSLTAEGFGSVKVLSHELAERVFTTKRQEILNVLEECDISSQRELARTLDRDPGAVQRDIRELVEADIVEIKKDGRSNRPKIAHDTVVIEPLVAGDVVDKTEYTVENEP